MIVVVGSEKGGVGKTAIVTNLAVYFVSRGYSCTIIDTDVQGSSREWLRIRNAGGVKPFIPHKLEIANPIPELTHEDSIYDVVLVDIGAQNYQTMLQCMSIADLVLVPTTPDQLELASTIKVMRSLRELDPVHPSKKVPAWVVLNGITTSHNSPEEAETREFLEHYKLRAFDASLRYRRSWKMSRKLGQAVHEVKGRSRDAKAGHETAALFDEVVAKLPGLRRSGKPLE
jgi:chromosome partitioning protein